MPIEILMLVMTGLLSLVVAVSTIAIHFRVYGGQMIRGNRDDFPRLAGVAMRVVRAHANLNEALLPFAIVVIAAAVLHVSNRLTVYAAIASSPLGWRTPCSTWLEQPRGVRFPITAACSPPSSSPPNCRLAVDRPAPAKARPTYSRPDAQTRGLPWRP
jgi:uncharacterized MAPEG superfamily protein